MLLLSSGLEYPTRDGFYPFLPAAESTDEVYIPDVSKINEKYFDFVDWVVDEAAKRGLVIALVPTWGRYGECRGLTNLIATNR